MEQHEPHQSQYGSTSDQYKPKRSNIAARVLAIFAVSAIMIPTAYFAAQNYCSPSFLGEYGVVGNVTALLNNQAPSGPLTPGLSLLLRITSARNQLNQDVAISKGALSAVTAVLASNSSGWGECEALRLLTGLMKGNPSARDAAWKEGALEELIRKISHGTPDSTVSHSAATLAEAAADSNAARKKKIGAAGGISALYQYLDTTKSAGGKPSINVAWALANLLADSSPNQGLLLGLGGSELLTKLVGNGPDQRITQPTLYAIANLASKSKAGQDSLNESGALEALVKMVEEGMAGFKSKASEPFHTEVLEHVAELQRNDPNVRSALAEVGGLEELLGIIEVGSEIKSSGSAREKQLVLAEGADEDDELHSIRSLVRDLQDEVDTEAGLMSDVKLPSLSRGPSTARILHQPKLLSRQGVLSVAAWALSNVIADNPVNQDAARKAGAVEALVKLLEGAEDAFVAKGALGAISSLVQGNPTNKLAVREANGIEGLVKLLASNPADKEVLQATANALKQMTAERPVFDTLQRSSSRWLRVLGRQISAFLFERLGVQVSPAVSSIFLVAVFTGFLLGFILLVLRGLLNSGSSNKSFKKYD